LVEPGNRTNVTVSERSSVGTTPDQNMRGTAVIVGASLSGLMTALALSRAGLTVTILEKSADTGRTGAAIHVEEKLLERIVGPRLTILGKEIPAGVQTWFTVHDGLREAASADTNIRLQAQTHVVSVDQDDDSAWAVTSAGDCFRADTVIGADGHRSVVREYVCPQSPDARFAGYLIWLGVAQESTLPSNPRWPTDVVYLESGDFILLGYPLPSADGSLQKGSRQLGWAWYDASRNGLLNESGSVVEDVVHHTLLARDVPEDVYLDLAKQAREHWTAPWRDAILNCIDLRAVIGTPIAEYVPDRLARGRVALVGGKGFGASLQDALALADAAGEGVHGCAGEKTLRRYEQSRLQPARSLVIGGQQFSRSFSSKDLLPTTRRAATS
jgi:2-polyprenyl-6-methoxyphenol hydroxylase-like FAD-dependent oxidoreductase